MMMEEPRKNTERLNEESPINYNTTLAVSNGVDIASKDIIVTMRLPEADVPVFTEAPIARVSKNERRSGHCIILYLPSILDPIQLWNQTLITLGRDDNHLNLHPTVDLSEHHAALLGVSRLHAEITYEDSNYYVRDLDSRNGTWVNKNKLVHDQKILLANHDTLRLAHLMIQVSSYQNPVSLLSRMAPDDSFL